MRLIPGQAVEDGQVLCGSKVVGLKQRLGLYIAKRNALATSSSSSRFHAAITTSGARVF